MQSTRVSSSSRKIYETSVSPSVTRAISLKRQLGAVTQHPPILISFSDSNLRSVNPTLMDEVLMWVGNWLEIAFCWVRGMF
ncbi:hypothetical protein ACOSQ2_008427 [Xanthoceras sorbifolium]